MVRTVIKFFDFIISSFLAALFLVIIGMMLAISIFKKKRERQGEDVVELYISIVDFRNSVISTQKEDMLLEGLVKKIFCYHFDFDAKRSERLYINNNIQMNNISVRPDNALTRVGFRKTVAYFVVAKTFFEMMRTAAQEGVNIIRAHDPHLLGFNAYILSCLMKVPFVVQICSNYELKDRKAKNLAFKPFIFPAFERWFERTIMRSSDMVITDREHYRSFGIIPKNIPEERYTNIGFFVNEVHYTPPSSRRDIRDELSIPKDKKILLYVGRLCEVKYPLDLLKMFKLCLAKRKDIVLLIVGGGVLKDEMERMAEEEGIKGNVFFFQRLSQDKLGGLYHAADVVCFTSAGFTMVEAALAERCIVAYDFEWHNEFVGKNERGVLVPFGNYHEFSKEVLGVLDEPMRRGNLGKAARAYALENYLREKSIEKEIAAYKSIFHRRGNAI